jgi:hypothetical protein
MENDKVGIDLGKSVFHLAGLSATGETVIRKKFSRPQLLRFTANLRMRVIGMEACLQRGMDMMGSNIFQLTAHQQLVGGLMSSWLHLFASNLDAHVSQRKGGTPHWHCSGTRRTHRGGNACKSARRAEGNMPKMTGKKGERTSLSGLARNLLKG